MEQLLSVANHGRMKYGPTVISPEPREDEITDQLLFVAKSLSDTE